MRVALQRHDTLLRGLIELQQGYIFKTIGDAFCAAFTDPLAALKAVIQIQHALLNEDWGDQIGLLRVRAVLYSGEAEERDGDYFGPVLNRASRLLGAAHGGQVLLSRSTYRVVADRLPDGVSLRFLGERRLKDLIQPEAIYQLLAAGLPSEFPPLRTLEPAPLNLPAQPTSFVGREQELIAVRELLRQPQVRLVCLTGPGGTGKTRLSLQVAADLAGEFEGGVYFVALSAVQDSNLVLPTIAQTLGVKETQPQSLLTNLKEFLQNKPLLLVLDNFEQVVGAAGLVGELMRAGPGVKFLVSSRERLHVYGEHEYPVPPLAQPDARTLARLDLADLTSYEAIRLFVERTRSVRPGFVLTEQNAPVVAEICARLDGLPLAIELAAARCKLFAPEVLLARLDQRLGILTGGSTNLPARQQTLRGAIDWSYELLSEPERRLFARLGVFAEGCTFEAADAVCHPAAETEWDTLSGLESLIDKSLLRVAEPDEAEPRFVMLGTLREYALEHLQSQGDAEQTRQRFVDYYLQLVDEAAPHLQGAAQVYWFNRLEQEHGNLRLALEQALTMRGGDRIGLQLGVSLHQFWAVRGYLSEGRELLNNLLAQTAPLRNSLIYVKAQDGAGILARLQGDLPAALALHQEGLAIAQTLGEGRAIARSHYNVGIVLVYLGEYQAAERHLNESLSLSRQIPDQSCEAQALNGLGNLALERQAYDEARHAYNRSLALSRELGDQRGIAGALNNLGSVETSQGRFAVATSIYAESVALNRELGDKYGTAMALNNLGLVLLEQDQFAAAEASLQESLLLSREVGNRASIAGTLSSLASIRLGRNDPTMAKVYLRESLQIQHEIGNQLGLIENLASLANVAAAESNLERAARLLGLIQHLSSAANLVLDTADQTTHQQNLALIYQELGQTAFQATCQEGQAMSLQQGMFYALHEG